MGHDRALAYIRRQVEEGIVPSAAVAIGRGNEQYALAAYGNACVHPLPVSAGLETLYDMASLTKTMATAIVAVKLAEAGRLSLFDTVGEYVDAPPDKKGVTLVQLLAHAGGLPAHIMMRDMIASPAEALELLLGLPCAYSAGQDVVYSCLGYILLGRILELAGGAPLDTLAQRFVYGPLGMASTGFRPQGGNIAATEFDSLANGWLCGLVHDENARFLGGVAGNAGLFCTIGDCARFASMLSCGGGQFLPPPAFDRMVANHTPGMAESRGLGFSLADGRPLSCGEFFACGSFGHTGFTGTSIWVDVGTRLYVVLLTNAVHYGRDRMQFFRARRIFHNLAALEYGGRA